MNFLQKNDEILALLEIDGEAAYHLVDHPGLLCLAMGVFQNPDIFVHLEVQT